MSRADESAEISKMFFNAASRMSLKDNFEKKQDFEEMGYWWQLRAVLDARFEKLITTPFLIQVLLFPYFIWAWRKYYKSAKLLNEEFSRLKLIYHAR